MKAFATDRKLFVGDEMVEWSKTLIFLRWIESKKFYYFIYGKCSQLIVYYQIYCFAQAVMRHYIGKKHGILDKYVKEELHQIRRENGGRIPGTVIRPGVELMLQSRVSVRCRNNLLFLDNYCVPNYKPSSPSVGWTVGLFVSRSITLS